MSGNTNPELLPDDKSRRPIPSMGYSDKEGSTPAPGGAVTLEVPSFKVGRLLRLKVLKTAGSCATFDVKLEDIATGATVINKVYEETGKTTLLDTSFAYILPFHNKDSIPKNKLYMTITPNADVDNTFDWRVEASPMVLLDV